MKINQVVLLLSLSKFYGDAATQFDSSTTTTTTTTTPTTHTPPTTDLSPTTSTTTSTTTTGTSASTTETTTATRTYEPTTMRHLFEIETQMSEFCTEGFRRNSTTNECEDMNECLEWEAPCADPSLTCVNFVGHYGCVCNEGLSQLITREGKFQGCYNVTSMTQRIIGIPYNDAMANTSSEKFNKTAIKWERIISNSYMAKNPENPLVNILKTIVVTKITKGSLVVWFDAYSSGKVIPPAMIRKIHNDSLETAYYSEFNFTLNFPRVAPFICTRKKIKTAMLEGQYYTFDDARTNTLVTSLENCQNSDYGYTATVECRTRKNTDGTETAYFEPGTLKEISCQQNVSSLLDQVKNMTLTTSDVETLMSTISVISSDFESATIDEVKDVVATLDEMKNKINEGDIQVTENTMSYLVWTTNNLNVAVKNNEENSTELLTTQEKVQFIGTLEVFASNLKLIDGELDVETDSSFFEAQQISQPDKETIKFRGPERNMLPKVTSYLPITALSGIDKNSTNALFFLHNDGALFPSPNDTNIKLNQVMSVQLSNTTLQNLVDPIVHTFPRPTPNKEKAGGNTIIRERCGYFSIPDVEWKFDGCITDIDKFNKATVCRCNHTTNFAVLVQTQYALNNHALDALGTFGCVCSIVGLVLLLVIYLSHRTLKTTLNIIHIQMSACLLVAYITFVAGVERTQGYEACIAVGVILQFSMLCTWGWMLVEFITMYKKLVIVFTHIGTEYLVKVSAIVYSSASLITFLTLTISLTTGLPDEYPGWSTLPSDDPNSFRSNYVSDRMCWLHSYSLYFGFLTPVAIILCINVIGFFVVLRTLTRSPPNLGQSRPTKPQLKNHAIRICMVSVLLGITWIFAIPLTITDDPTVNEIFSWLFSLSNAFQGLFLFLLYCVVRENVREVWIESLKKLMPCCKLKRATKKDSTATTSTTQSGASAIHNRRIKNFNDTDQTTLTPEEKYATIDIRVTSI